MNLPTYIKQIGDEKAAKLFGVKIRTVASWRRGERLPRPKQAEKIIRASRGAMSFTDIYSVKTAVRKKRPDPHTAPAIG